MLELDEKDTEESLLLAVRVSNIKVSAGLNRKGTKEKYLTYKPHEVMNMHLEKLDDGFSSVFYSTNSVVSDKYKNNIRQVLLFSSKERWYVICDAKVFTNSIGEYILDEADENKQVDPWINVAKRTWIEIYNYRQITDISELNKYNLVNNDNKYDCLTLGELIKLSQRFNTAYCFE